MNPPKRPGRLPKEERRAQLLECAVRVAARRGLGRLGHTEVAREIGVAIPTVFMYFPSRAELVGAVIDEVDRFYMAQTKSFHQRDREPHRIIFDQMRAFADSVEADPDYAQIWLEWSTSVRNESGTWTKFLDYQKRTVRIFAHTIRRAHEPGVPPSLATDAARMVVASAYTIAQLKFMGSPRRTVDTFLEHMVELAFHVPAG